MSGFRHLHSTFTIAVLILAAAGSAFAQGRTFTVSLVPSPGVAYNPRGTATFTLSADGSALTYSLSVVDVHDPTIAVLEDTRVGEMDGIIAYLAPSQYPPYTRVMIGNDQQLIDVPTYDYTDPNKDFTLSGVFGSGTITADFLTGYLAGKTMASLMADIQAGYVKVAVMSADYSQDALTGILQ